MRGHHVTAEAGALADHDAADEAGDPGIDVHDGAAGEVDRAEAVDQASRRAIGARTTPEPDHVGDREVDEGEPQDGEEDDGGELDALGEGTDDQAGGDGREGHLEADEHQFRMATPLVKLSDILVTSTPARNTLEKPPTKELRLPPSVKASE